MEQVTNKEQEKRMREEVTIDNNRKIGFNHQSINHVGSSSIRYYSQRSAYEAFELFTREIWCLCYHLGS
jgi:hypothetical protein